MNKIKCFFNYHKFVEKKHRFWDYTYGPGWEFYHECEHCQKLNLDNVRQVYLRDYI